MKRNESVKAHYDAGAVCRDVFVAGVGRSGCRTLIF